MKTTVVFALATLATLAAAGSSVVAGTADGGDLPITKVIKLLEGMKSELMKEFEADKDLYEELKCWCDKAKEEKEHAVAYAKDHMDVLLSDIMSMSAHYKAYELDIKNAQESYKVTDKALDEAIVLDAKQKEEYEKEVGELITNIGLLKGAIVALSNNGYALTQGESREKIQHMLPGLRKLVHEHLQKLGWMDDSQKDTLKTFLDATPEIFQPDPTRADEDQSFIEVGAATVHKSYKASSKLPVHKSYAPQSGQIFGILKQMKEEFEQQLPEVEDSEKKRSEEFMLMKGSKEAELKAYLAEIKEKTRLWSELGQKLVEAKADMKATKTAYATDVAFLSDLGVKCQTLESDWAKRKKLRMDEIAAVGEAISILSSDEALDAQATTFSLLQKSSTSLMKEEVRSKAAKVLKRFRHPEVVALLAMLSRDDPFAKVFAAIDDLLAKLKQQQADEVKHRDFCIDEFHQAESESAEKQHALEKVTADIADLVSQRNETETEVAELHDSIFLMKSELQRAGEDRVKENLEFQETVAAQMSVQMALAAAYEKLAAFYHKNHAAMLQHGRDSEAAAGKAALAAGTRGALKSESLFWASRSQEESAFWKRAEIAKEAQEAPPAPQAAQAPRRAASVPRIGGAALSSWLDDPQTLDQKTSPPAFLQRGSSRGAQPPALLQNWLNDQEPSVSSSSTSVTKTTEVVVDESALGEKKVATVEKPGPPTAGEANLEGFAKMGDYENNAGGNSVTTLIQKLIGDAKVLEVEATHDEQAAEDSYQKYLAETNLSIEQAYKEIAEKIQLIAEIDTKKTQAEQDQKQYMLDLESLSNTVAALHQECDYLLKNFEVRQTKRAEEMDALNEVKAILKGAKTP